MSNNDCSRKEDNFEYTLNVCSKFKVSIQKPLIPLKIILFCYYGAGSFITAFITVYFKQRGVTLAELSTTYMISPVIQISGTLLSGIIADKIGRSKPVLVANLLLTGLMLVCILLVPRPGYINCSEQTISIQCDSPLLNPKVSSKECEEPPIGINICDEQCINNFTRTCGAKRTLGKSANSSSFLKYERNEMTEVHNLCTATNLTKCKCNSLNGTLCVVECVTQTNNCYDEDQRSMLSKVAMVLYIFWMTAFSNTYRICDVTAMYLVKEYDADFGKQRVFSMTGSVVISTIAGYLVKITTPAGGEKNYLIAFYFFISLVTFCILVVYKLDVRVRPPGQKMGKKATTLLKNPDVLAFGFVVLILGSSFNFSSKFLFWYLEELQAPSILVGLIPAIGALYGLPFLFTSEWWMKKIGTTKFFIIGLLGYVMYGIGYSLLKNPWLSLLLESHNIVTYHLLWVAVILRSHEIAPEGLTATVISAAGSIHYQIGKTSGSLIARVVMNRYGGPIAFQVLAAMCFISAVLYSLYLYFRRGCVSNQQLSKQNRTEMDEKP
ncbi:major facilitator superfamily domain-containing protein 6-A [Parasteatoda tepidariorum]|nr:major facilitator superfamily domain-containing protein 6-A [Parasteatoda tepidariorum]